jgi:epsilon-lactone hydrolase
MAVSFSAQTFAFVLRTTGIVRRGFSGGPRFQKNLAKIRAAPLPEPAAKLRHKVKVEHSEFEGRPVWTLSPKDRVPSAHMLYWHGGGYVYPASDFHYVFLAEMAEKHGWSVTAPLYPLAPEQQVTAIQAWAMAFYRDYLNKHSGAFFMGGDSAGGGMTAAVSMMARDAGLRMPQGLLLICPWLDVVPDHPDQAAIEPRDAILTIRGIDEAGRLYAGDMPLNDPAVSPIHGNWHDGLPPVLAFGGGDDILVTDARALKTKLPSMDYVEGDKMIHVWPIMFFPEARAAQKNMADFVRRHA